jgi:hypothetical protein
MKEEKGGVASNTDEMSIEIWSENFLEFCSYYSE